MNLELNFQNEFQKLNPEQKKAVNTIYGPVLVVAGPGTGKTQILALRIANILMQTDTLASNILCLTFTEAGVTAMRSRLSKYIGKEANQIGIFTFHSLANEIIQKQNKTNDKKQLDEISKIDLFLKLKKEFETKPKSSFNLEHQFQRNDKWTIFDKVEQIIKDISTLKRENIGTSSLSEFISLQKNYLENLPKKTKKNYDEVLKKLEPLEELYLVYKRYLDYSLENNLYDFDDMILNSIDDLEKYPETLANLQEQYQFIMVDEFQDTNGSQNRLIQILCNYDKSPNIFAVGDDDQSIYRFQGANVENILSFLSEYPQATFIPALTNYRSTQVILETAENIISENQNRLAVKIPNFSKKLISSKSQKLNYKGDLIQIKQFENETLEHQFILEKVKELIQKGVPPDEIAILYRKNKEAEEIKVLLKNSNISFSQTESENIFDKDIIKNIINLILFIENPFTFSAKEIYNICLYSWTNLNPAKIWANFKKISSEKDFFYLAVNEQSEIDKDIKNFFLQILELHHISRNISFSILLEKIFIKFDILNFFYNDKSSSESFENLSLLLSFTNFIKSKNTSNYGIIEFKTELKIINDYKFGLNIASLTPEEKSIKLLTIHSSKGLEFEHVFLIHSTKSNLDQTRESPSFLIPELINPNFSKELSKSDKEEDNARLYFVGVTRAKSNVYITYSEKSILENKKTNLEPTRFISQINEANVDFEIVKENFKLDNLMLFLKPIEISFRQKENEFLKTIIPDFSLTASKLNSYLLDPEEFKKIHLLNTPKELDIHSVTGSLVHKAMEIFNLEMINHNFPTLEYLTSKSISSLNPNFPEEISNPAKKDFLHFFKLYYEKVLKISENQPALLTEHSFNSKQTYLEIPDDFPLKISGRLDKLEKINQNDNLNFENTVPVRVVDYKNTIPKSENAIKGISGTDKSYWRQIVFYKLLGDLDYTFRLNPKANSAKFVITEAEINFIKPASSGRFKAPRFSVYPSDVETLKELIYKVVRNIRNLSFEKVVDE